MHIDVTSYGKLPKRVSDPGHLSPFWILQCLLYIWTS